ncbi:hypothetical protein [Gluconobacter cerinus]|uniref:Uncharacterized protein n=1 Tax=Gluconobacter cerinus TaxID=38307 RepID=A0A1B6VQ13_9PROT|nr:hypothetical protein [Gluconobacter cerinus]OAJ69284.1 hypothetical protein A0123_00093 [Gluconobacter cerinus]
MTEERPRLSAPSHSHDPEELRSARLLSLGRIPATNRAHALATKISDDLRPHLGDRAKAALGGRDKGRERRIRETGIILAGLLRHGLSGDWSAVNESPSTWFWKAARKLPVKHNAFWSKIDAMRTLGLLDHVQGLKFKNVWGNHQGHAARLRPSKTLIAMAQRYGCTPATAGEDWKLITPAPVEPLAPKELLAFTAIPTKVRGKISEDSRRPMNVPPGCEDLQAFMRALTGRLAEIEFTGCAPPVLQARFIGTREFGGRIYAHGVDNYQNGIGKTERSHITMNGEAVAELDLSASYLSIALALLGSPAPAGDPYALPGLEETYRDAIKHWFVLFWQTGKAPQKWPKKTPSVVRESIKPQEIKGPAFARYPALKDVESILPETLQASIPKPMRNWAVGQYLTGVEASIMRQAMSGILESGGIVLPMHDGVIIPCSQVAIALRAIKDACTAQLNRKIRTEVKKKYETIKSDVAQKIYCASKR